MDKNLTATEARNTSKVGTATEPQDTVITWGPKSLRMEIAIEAMKALLAKDFKNIGFSAFNQSKANPADYIADQAFILADAMIERENKKEVEGEKDA